MDDFFESIDFKMVSNVVTTINPVAGLLVKGVDAIVNSENENISDNSIVTVLEAMAKSSKNKADDKLICLVKAYLKCENK